MRKPTISVRRTYSAIRIYFGSVLHLHLDRSNLLAVQSWVTNGQLKFCIQFTMRGGDVLCEYDSRAKWETILRGLEEAI